MCLKVVKDRYIVDSGGAKVVKRPQQRGEQLFLYDRLVETVVFKALSREAESWRIIMNETDLDLEQELDEPVPVPRNLKYAEFSIRLTLGQRAVIKQLGWSHGLKFNAMIRRLADLITEVGPGGLIVAIPASKVTPKLKEWVEGKGFSSCSYGEK